MSVYRIHFTWNKKEVAIKATSLDLTHPYFVSMKGLILPESNGLIIDPSRDELTKAFGEADHIMIPFQTVSLIEELKDSDPADELGLRHKVTPFHLIENEDEGKDDQDKEPEA
ncbi:DUF1820 family protein [Sediminispirochaeta bajacaliforniensis]|uniref:DUF1820 family protein n=1 Tax=Sediminispirochaeta bajacaliforniensis TaxID=148 RepID=UPI00036589ED|nr:DUF1820 family protein [Sediminispirochaeta bajacaliforniensis]